VVAELHRLSEGDPLLVRLYVDDLWRRGEAVVRLRPEDLRDVRPGLEGYFLRWWDDQRRLWGAQTPLRGAAGRAVRRLRAGARGPRARDELLRLAPPAAGLNPYTLEEALRPLARLVAGDGARQGYAFSHPRLGAHFYERLAPAERRQVEQ